MYYIIVKKRQFFFFHDADVIAIILQVYTNTQLYLSVPGNLITLF
jgi:hypothetical protein